MSWAVRNASRQCRDVTYSRCWSSRWSIFLPSSVGPPTTVSAFPFEWPLVGRWRRPFVFEAMAGDEQRRTDVDGRAGTGERNRTRTGAQTFILPQAPIYSDTLTVTKTRRDRRSDWPASSLRLLVTLTLTLTST